MAIEEKLHTEGKKALHRAEEPLEKQVRKRYEIQEKPHILQVTAEAYLGKYAKSKEIRDVLISKADEAGEQRKFEKNRWKQNYDQL